MYDLVEFHDCLRRVAAILNRCQVRFSITGGAAAIAYGDPRTTQDVDLLVDAVALKAQMAEFLGTLQGAGFLFNEQTIREAVASGRQFQLIDTASTLKLDLYPRELVPGELNRAGPIEIAPGLSLPIASRPDLVISKLIWISKGSHKSRRDVKQIMLRVTDSERELIGELADQMQLQALLDEVLAEPDEIDA